MDVVSMVSAFLTAQAGSMQSQAAASMLKQNLDSQKSAVLTLLGIGQQGAPSLANVGAGIGGNVNISA